MTGERLAVIRTIGGGAVSSAGRAPALQAGGRWFEPGTAQRRRAWKQALCPAFALPRPTQVGRYGHHGSVRGAQVRLWHGDGLVTNPRGHPETLRPLTRARPSRTSSMAATRPRRSNPPCSQRLSSNPPAVRRGQALRRNRIDEPSSIGEKRSICETVLDRCRIWSSCHRPRGEREGAKLQPTPGETGLLQERRDAGLAADPVDEERHLVEVAPVPVFAGLERADDRVRGSVACAACRLGESSQQPTWPQVRQIRRCSHLPPVRRQSSQPSTEAGSSRTAIWSRWLQTTLLTRSLERRRCGRGARGRTGRPSPLRRRRWRSVWSSRSGRRRPRTRRGHRSRAGCPCPRPRR